MTVPFYNIALIRSSNLRPSYSHVDELRGKNKLRFLNLLMEGGEWLIAENVGGGIGPDEIPRIEEEFRSKGADRIFIRNGILYSKLHPANNDLMSKINGIPGCRIGPLHIWNADDVYFPIEYFPDQSRRVSDIILSYLSDNHSLSTSLEYMGSYSGKIPFMLNLFQSLGGNLGEYSVVTTAWDATSSEITNETSGIFLNAGMFYPKILSDSDTGKMIYQSNGSDFRGLTPEVVDKNQHIYEIPIRTRFFRDFYESMKESGIWPLILSAVSDGSVVTNNMMI
ncbi:MAG: hypothetical protein QXN26_00840, partial [Thermoplasmataceae archaeon]